MISLWSLYTLGLLTIPPTASNVLLKLKIPSIGTWPTVGLSAYSAARFAGVIREPIVSVPTASVLNPEATATAEPVDDPPGAESSQCSFLFAMCLETYGDWHCPPTADHPGGIDGFFKPQNSVKLDFPMMIMPFMTSRSTTVAFLFGMHPANAYEPTQKDEGLLACSKNGQSPYRRLFPFPGSLRS